MSFTARTRIANPRLGSYFGIFMSAFAGLAMLLLIFEGLGVENSTLSIAMLAGPVVLYLGIGLASYTADQLDYFASGRRISAFYTGLGLALTAMGATGVLALGGAFFLIGFDALCIVIGGLAGFVVLAVLLAPFFRKFGTFTVPSYLGRRFSSRTLRLVAAALMAVPLVLLLAAELRIGAFAVSQLAGTTAASGAMLLAATLVLILGAGGMRSLMWSGTAQGIACMIAIMVPVAVIAVILTNLPFPQLSHGPLMRTVGRSEAQLGLPIILPPSLAFDIPDETLQAVTKRFADALGSVGPLAFVIVMLTTMAGTAAAPWLLPRVAATPGVYEARKSIGWATVLFGLLMMTLASAALFMRSYLISIFATKGTVTVPDWVSELAAMNAIAIANQSPKLQISSLLFARDSVLFDLPVAAGLPDVAVYLVAAGIVAAALAAAGSAAVALGNIISEDIVNGLSWEPVPDKLRLALARVGLAVAALLGGLIAVLAPTDPLKLLLWAFVLTGSSAFPVLVLSIWWKRLNVFGALAGMVTGFGVAVLAIIAGEAGWSGIDSALSGILAIPAGTVATIAVAMVTPVPGKHVSELLRDIRVPGGEILYDREMRLLQRKKIQRN